MKAFSLIVSAPLASITCNGSSTASIPSILCSPKYILLASSRASCHISCHKIATRISSFDTSCAWCNKVELECYASFLRRSTANEANLVNKTSTMLADLINDLLCCTLSQYTYWFAGNQERIHQCLIKMSRQKGKLEGQTSPCCKLYRNIWQLLPPFQIVGHFGKSRYIIFAMYIDIAYI